MYRGQRSCSTLGLVRVRVHDPARRDARGTDIGFSAHRTDQLLRRRRGGLSSVTDQPIKIAECLAQSFPQVVEFADPLPAISEKLVDPFEDDGTAHLLESAALDFFGFAVG